MGNGVFPLDAFFVPFLQIRKELDATMSRPKDVQKVPVENRVLLNFYEAAEYSGLGINKLRAESKNVNCPWVFHNGGTVLIKRIELEKQILQSKGM